MGFGLIIFLWFTYSNVLLTYQLTRKKINPLLIDPSSAQPRIKNGVPAVPHEFPWLVEIRRVGFHDCGGTIINPRFVVTAAHCVLAPRGELLVYAREHNIYCPEGAEELREVVNIRIHENYSRVTKENDIAVIGVDPPFRFNKYVKTLALPPANFQFTDKALVGGWGHLRFPDEYRRRERNPDKLRKVELQRFPDSNCSRAYFHVDPAVNLCYGGENKGSCLGDSGGSVVCRTPNGDVFLCGVVSYAYKCARKGYPSVFVRVPHFVQWIRDNSKLNGINGPTFRKCGGYFDGYAATFIFLKLQAGTHCSFVIEAQYERQAFLMDQWALLPEDEVYITDNSQICDGCRPIKLNLTGSQKTFGFRATTSLLILTIRLSPDLPRVERFLTFTFVSEGGKSHLYPLTNLNIRNGSRPRMNYRTLHPFYYNNKNVLYSFMHSYKGRAQAMFNFTRMQVEGGPTCQLDNIRIYHLLANGRYKQEARYCSQSYNKTLEFQVSGLIFLRFVSSAGSVFGRGFAGRLKFTPE